MSKRQGEYITCGNCKSRISLEEAKELGYVEYVLNTIIVNCPYCDNQTHIFEKE